MWCRPRQKQQLSIVTTRSLVSGSVSYDFYFHNRKPPRASEKICGETIVSVKRLPKIFSELPDALAAQEAEHGWKIIGKIKYVREGSEALMHYYHPKDRVDGEVKRLGYYISSISASHLAREDGATVISSISLFEHSGNSGKQPFVESHEHVSLKVDLFAGLYVQAREYLQAMGKGIREKVDISRAARGSA